MRPWLPAFTVGSSLTNLALHLQSPPCLLQDCKQISESTLSKAKLLKRHRIDASLLAMFTGPLASGMGGSVERALKRAASCPPLLLFLTSLLTLSQYELCVVP